MQQLRLFIIGILCMCLSVFVTANTEGLTDMLSSTNDSINLKKRDSLRLALSIPVNDSLLNRDGATLRKIFFKLYNKKSLQYYSPDKEELKDLIQSIELYAKQKNDATLGFFMMYTKIVLNLDNLSEKTLEQHYFALHSPAKDLNLYWLQSKIDYQLGILYIRSNRVSKGFNSLFRALYVLENNLSDPETTYDVISYIGLLAYQHEQYQLSKRYFKKAVDTKKYKKLGAYNNLALAYTRLKMLDSANYYFNLEKQFAISENDDDFLIIVNGNIGENLYRKGNSKAALPLLVADANYSLSKNWFGNASNALIYISACYLELDEPAKSEQFMWKAYRFAKKDNELRRMKPIYKQFARWYAYKGDANKTLLYSDSLQYVSEQLHIKFDEFSGFEADKLVKLSASELELLQKQKQQEVSKKVIWILVISSIFTIILSLLLFVNFRSRKLLKEKSLALSNSQLKGRLEDATSQLNIYLKETQQKLLIEKVILTDADWREFLQFFNKVYPSFFSSIKQKYPKLSKAELRFCCLSYLSLSDKEMSAMLGVGRASIRVTRGRTRAKLQLTATDSLEKLLLLI